MPLNYLCGAIDYRNLSLNRDYIIYVCASKIVAPLHIHLSVHLVKIFFVASSWHTNHKIFNKIYILNGYIWEVAQIYYDNVVPVLRYLGSTGQHFIV